MENSTPPRDDAGRTLTRVEAERLAGELQQLAAAQASLDADFCDLVDRFDAGTGITWFDGIKTTAHLLSWACSMTPGVAREHVRVARALRDMPTVRALFSQGRLTYSKVREITRLVGVIDEADFCALACEMTASQLARTVSAFRTAAGTRIQAEPQRTFRHTTLGNGMVRLSVVLPAEDAAVVTAAVEAAARRALPETSPAESLADAEPPADAEPRPSSGADPENVPAGTSGDLAEPGTHAEPADAAEPGDPADHADSDEIPRPFPALDRVQALVDIAGSYLDTLPGEPRDDHTVVMVQVSAELLLGTQPENVPAGTFSPAPAVPRATAPALSDVPAGTFSPASDVPGATQQLRAGTCHVEGHGPIEPATAQRLACTATLLGAIVDRTGDVLALGRSTRLATRAQRRALKVRDRGSCQFPGCHQTSHLDAHHLQWWSRGGPTDLDNLVLLCRRHHTFCHEGGVRILREDGPVRFRFLLPDGESLTGSWREAHTDPNSMQYVLGRYARAQNDPDPTRVFPPHAGAGFLLHECVRVLFQLQTPIEPDEETGFALTA